MSQKFKNQNVELIENRELLERENNFFESARNWTKILQFITALRKKIRKTWKVRKRAIVTFSRKRYNFFFFFSKNLKSRELNVAINHKTNYRGKKVPRNWRDFYTDNWFSSRDFFFLLSLSNCKISSRKEL